MAEKEKTAIDYITPRKPRLFKVGESILETASKYSPKIAAAKDVYKKALQQATKTEFGFGTTQSAEDIAPILAKARRRIQLKESMEVGRLAEKALEAKDKLGTTKKLAEAGVAALKARNFKLAGQVGKITAGIVGKEVPKLAASLGSKAALRAFGPVGLAAGVAADAYVIGKAAVEGVKAVKAESERKDLEEAINKKIKAGAYKPQVAPDGTKVN